jgi:hypothetical protein
VGSGRKPSAHNGSFLLFEDEDDEVFLEVDALVLLLDLELLDEVAVAVEEVAAAAAEPSSGTGR